MNLFRIKPATFFYGFLAFLLLADLAYSAYQHYNMPLGGDMAEVILPSPGQGYDQVLHDPFGLNALIYQEHYPNPNRFFAHWTASEYFKTMPFFLQKFTNPLNSIYLSAAILKTLTQVLLIFLLAVYISRPVSLLNSGFLVAALLVTPFFQTSGFCRTLGIIDQSVIYTIFYALPLGLLLLFYLPFFKIIFYRENPKLPAWKIIFLVLLMIILSLNGPLIPGVVLITTSLVLFGLWLKNFRDDDRSVSNLNKLPGAFRKIPAGITYIFISFALLSLYSLYTGSFNSLNDPASVPLLERYLKIPTGLYNLMTKKLAFPILLFMIIFNYVWIKRKFNTGQGKDLLKLAGWIGIFAIIYILLLPLGGYRGYRENIVRYDTIMPVTLGLVFIFGKTSFYLYNIISGRTKYLYTAMILAGLIIFTAADSLDTRHYQCERSAIELISNSQDEIVRLPADCPVMEWRIITNPAESSANAELFRFWNVTNMRRLYFQSE